MNIIEILKQRLQKHPNKPALLHKEKQISYKELDIRSRATSSFFSKHSITQKNSALLLVPLSIELYILFLGLIRSGITVVLIDPSAGRKHISKCIGSVKPDALIASPKAHLLRLIDEVQRIPKKFSTHFWVPGSTPIQYTKNNVESSSDYACAPDHPALITFTSGSTGMPKGISRSHSFLMHQHQAIASSLNPEDTDIELNTLPVFVLSNLASGITTVIPSTDVRKPAIASAQRLIHQIQRSKANRLLMPPALCKNLVDHLQTKQQTLRQIKKIYTGGGPVFPNLLHQLSTSFPESQITALYGSTEAEPIAHINMQEVDPASFKAMQEGRGLLVGRVVKKMDLAIIPDKDGTPIGPFTHDVFHKLTLQPMSAGEIVVSGAHVQKSYISNDDKSTKFKVGDHIWHRTGDAGYIDSKRRLWLLGRCSAKIVKGQKIIYPFEAEVAAMSFAGVKKAALTSVKDTIILAIETSTQDKASLCTQIKSSLKNIDQVLVLKKIPVDQRHNSKVLYAKLRELLVGARFRQ